MADIVLEFVNGIIMGIKTEPTRYALIIGFITSVVLFFFNEWAKRRYLIHEKLLSLRLERFELILKELYFLAAIYNYRRMVFEIKIVDSSVKTKADVVNVNRFIGKIFSKNIISENEIWEATIKEELENKKLTLLNFLQDECLIIYNNVQHKSAVLHLIMPDKTIQSKAVNIANNIVTYSDNINLNKEYLNEIRYELDGLVNSMRTYLPSLSIIDF